MRPLPNGKTTHPHRSLIPERRAADLTIQRTLIRARMIHPNLVAVVVARAATAHADGVPPAPAAVSRSVKLQPNTRTRHDR